MTKNETKINEVVKMSKEKKETENPFDNVPIGKTYVTAQDLLAVDDVLYEDVDVSKWVGEGATIRLKSLSAREAFTFIDSINQSEGMIQIVVKSAVDKDGALIFTPAQAEVLKSKSFGMFAKIQKAAMILNGLREPDLRTKLKNV